MTTYAAPNMLTGTEQVHPGMSPDSLDSLLMNGVGGWRAELGSALTKAVISFKIDGTATVTFGIEDEHRTMLRSSLLAQTSVVTIDGVRFVLCHIDKTGPSLELQFEHSVPNSLKMHTQEQVIAAGAMSRVDFVKKLASAESWIKVSTPPGYKGPVSNVQLAVGDPTANHLAPSTVNGPPPNYWDTMGTVLTDIGWRRFSRGANELVVAPDQLLLLADPVYDFGEDSPGVDSIDFTWDSNIATVDTTLNVRAESWAFPVGLCINLHDMGLVSARHLITDIERDLFSPNATVTASLPTPILPEPPPQDTSTAGSTDAQSEADILASLGLSPASTTTPGQSQKIQQFLAFAQSKVGGPYVWGGTGPTGYDCSGLVQAAAGSIGVKLPRYSVDQYNACVLAGGKITLDDAYKTPGALLFHNTPEQHVAISRGDGTTIEAMNSRVGIVNGNARGRGWTDAATLPL